MASSSSSPAGLIARDAESSASQLLSGQQETINHVAVVEGEQVLADNRVISLRFSRGYPVSREELHDYFTRRHGDIIEAIHMGVGSGDGGQALSAMMVLHSADKTQEIVNDGRAIFSINGKHVWARTLKA